MEPQLSLRRLEIFRLVVEERSVTRAAAILMIAQPAVSSQLRALEKWLGAKLFTRRGSQIELTEAGERANAWAKAILASAAELRRDVDGIESGGGGSVVAAASIGVGSYLLPAVLTRFRERHPGADMTLNVLQPQDALRQISSGEADFAVTTWDADETRTNVHTTVLRDEPVLIVVRGDRRPENRVMSIEEALRLPLVAAPRVVAAQRAVSSQLSLLTDAEPNVVIRLGHPLAAKQAVIDHGWATILPRYVVAADVAAGVLATVEVPGLDLRERIVVAWRRDKVFSKLQQTLVAEIRDRLGEFHRAE
ncbi:LysR family transcriptional regulator [Actinomadura bangladeshensis]|uniref:LysR family transcriptional regulator n=1 Tax=Actinomadura bangladeshensis TaxID=453573 RepID=A0A4R4P9Q4_9ACTN|nr:LysR family transcriptional regulator [Actinomadura bangladeshensis]TDC19288.1 LysR family transcriptional regulator [Actinomadura bangladeshensis]